MRISAVQIAILLLGAWTFSLGHEIEHHCIHDSIASKTIISDHQVSYDNHPLDPEVRRRGRHLAASYSPIRITAVPVRMETSSALNDFLTNKLMPAALAKLQAYLNVVPVTGNAFFSRFCNSRWDDGAHTCAGYDTSAPMCGEVVVPASDIAPATYYPKGPNQPPVTIPGGTGRANTDMIIYFQSVQSGSCPSQTGSGTIAYAAACVQDQYGRPTVGYINFCPTQISADPNAFYSQTMTAVHELTHALGFSSGLFKNYRDVKTGLPRTQVTASSTARGKTVNQVVTPSVVDAVRQHYNCPTLTGAELEDQGGSGTAGSHWEKLTFGNEYMTGVTTGVKEVMSAVTFALLQDSGWYAVPTTGYDALAWGRNRGCNFVNNKCVSNGVSSDPQYFCTDSKKTACDANRSGYGPCNLVTYTSSLPSQFQYFSNSAQGGGFNVVDYCPMYRAYSNRMCSDSASGQASSGNRGGEAYASSTQPSKCFDSTLGGGRNAGCYRYNCVCTSGAVSIAVTACTDVNRNKCETKTCTTPGSTISFTGYSGSITCPKVEDICSSKSDFLGGIGTCSVPAAPKVTPLVVTNVVADVDPAADPFDSTTLDQSADAYFSGVGVGVRNNTNLYIGIGAGVAGVALMAAVAIFVVRRRNNAASLKTPTNKAAPLIVNQKEVALASPVSKLPEGWTEQVDPATGHKYYFNASKDLSQWVRPIA